MFNKARGLNSSLALRLPIVLSLILSASLLIPMSVPANAAPARSLVDRLDDLKGPQVHLIYAIPSDAVDQSWDINGQYKTWIDRAQEWLNTQISKRLRFDTFGGELDISFLKSKLTTAEMRTKSRFIEGVGEGVLETLLNEFLAQSPRANYKESPKTYLFMISENIKESACGYANLGSVLALGYTGQSCWQGPEDDQRSDGSIPWPSVTIIHEVFHTYGVEHTCDDVQDLMWGSGCQGNSSSNLRYIDRDRQSYYGGEKNGVDISKLPIWNDSQTTSAYAIVKPKSANAPKLANGDFIFVVGKSDARITWDWERLGSTFNGGYSECTLSNGESMISTNNNSGECIFEIPLTWRGGSIATAKNKIWLGPFSGESTTPIKLWNPDGEFAACTSDFCFEKEVLSLSSNTCYGSDHKFFTLEQFADGAWKPITATQSRRTDRCEGTYWEPTPTDVEFTKSGSFIYRWVAGDTTISRGLRQEPARYLNILKSNAPYPMASSKDGLISSKKLILDEISLISLRESLCASSKGCYVGLPWTAPVLCYGDDVGMMDLEIFKDNKWQTIRSGPTKKGENGCGNAYSTPSYSMTFTEPGAYSFRWKATPGGKYSFSTSNYEIKIDVVPPSKSGTSPLTTTQYTIAKVSELSQAVIRSRAEATAKAKAEEEARIKAEAEALAKAKEEARIKAEAEAIAKAKAEEEARMKAEVEALAKAEAEEEARMKAEAEALAKAKVEALAKAKAEALAKAKLTVITCIKGKITKRVSGVKPKCPVGFKLKK